MSNCEFEEVCTDKGDKCAECAKRPRKSYFEPKVPVPEPIYYLWPNPTKWVAVPVYPDG